MIDLDAFANTSPRHGGQHWKAFEYNNEDGPGASRRRSALNLITSRLLVNRDTVEKPTRVRRGISDDSSIQYVLLSSVVRTSALLSFRLIYFFPSPVRQADQNEDSCNKPSNLPEIS